MAAHADNFNSFLAANMYGGPAAFVGSSVQFMGTGTIGGLGHQGQVQNIRKKFKELSKEEFRNLSNKPIVKEIMPAALKLSKEEILERIKEHI